MEGVVGGDETGCGDGFARAVGPKRFRVGGLEERCVARCLHVVRRYAVVNRSIELGSGRSLALVKPCGSFEWSRLGRASWCWESSLSSVTLLTLSRHAQVLDSDASLSSYRARALYTPHSAPSHLKASLTLHTGQHISLPSSQETTRAHHSLSRFQKSESFGGALLYVKQS